MVKQQHQTLKAVTDGKLLTMNHPIYHQFSTVEVVQYMGGGGEGGIASVLWAQRLHLE